MSTIVVRASDTALAMDEVIRRLGQDAYILSTKQKDGQVEIRATTEAPRQRRAPRIDVPGKTFGEVLAERTAAAPTPSAVAAPPREVHEPVTLRDPTPPHQPAFRPDVTRPMGGWPGLSPAFVADLWVELGQPEGKETGFLGQLTNAVLSPMAAGQSARTLVVGPQGAGKSLTVARLAALMMTERAGLRPRIVAPRRARLMGADALQGHARLMGLSVERPLYNELRLRPEWGVLDNPHAPQIFDLGDVHPEQVAEMVIPSRTEVILCLPAGLHPGMIARQAARWSGLGAVVCLTRTDDWPPTPEELSAIAASGLRLGLVGRGAGLIDTLSRPTRADVRGFAQGWLSHAGGPRS